MKLKPKAYILIVILAITLICILSSCGARKTQKTESKVTADTEKIKTQKKKDSLSVAQTATKKEQKTVSENKATLEKNFKFIPRDDKKPIVFTDFEGKKYSVDNAIIETTEKQTNTNKNTNQTTDTTTDTKIIETTKDDIKETAKAKVVSGTTTQNTDRKNVMDMFWVIIALAVCISVLLYWSVRKNGKDNNY